MSDYADSINIHDYKYRRPVYYTSPFSIYTTNVVVKLILNSENFNFNLTNTDGSDFRLLSGTGVLKMCKAYWSKANKHAVLFFKLPSIGGDTSIILDAYWGNSSAISISDPESMGFLFYESFSGSTLSSSKWSGSISAGSTSYGYSITQTGFTSVTNPLNGKCSWTMEASIYAGFSATPSYGSDTYWAVGFGFIGTENNFNVGFLPLDRIKTNAIPPGQSSYTWLTKSYGGLEPYSYQDVRIDYYEPDDRITVKLQSRNFYDDVEYQIWRKVEGDTRPKNIKINGPEGYGSYPSYISWLVIREYDSAALGSLDGRDLYVPYAYVPAQEQDYRAYLSDFTITQYKHESSFGGNPYALSDEGFDADSNAWVSDDGASLSGVALTIHIGWQDDITSTDYTHYDSGHSYYYNASKLSNDNLDRMRRNHWNCTTTSGWAAIKFTEYKTIGAFRIKSMPASNPITTEGCPKSFIFYGSNLNPALYFDSAIKLIEGTFENTTEWQSRVIHNIASYKYYILNILNTHDNKNIKIQEWEMMHSLGQVERKYPTQLRIHPAIYSNWEYNFPKEISLLGSIDSINWTTLIPWTFTYTPFMQHYEGYGYWQRYSFNNVNGFWSFRLLCRGNWEAEDNKIIIGEWSLHELEEESYTYRILDGTTNNIQQIWATVNCGVDDKYSIIFISNDKMNKISNNSLVGSSVLPIYYEDFNVI
jgi:hypothetical protein